MILGTLPTANAAKAPFSKLGAAVFGCFLVTSLLVPVAPLNKALFALLMLWTAVMFFVKAERSAFAHAAPITVFLIHYFGYVVSFFHRTDESLSLQLLLTTLTLFLLHFARALRLDLDWQMKVGGMIVCAFTGLMLWTMFNGGRDASGGLVSLFLEYSAGASGERSFSSDSLLMFHVGSVPFLFLPFCLIVQDSIEKLTLPRMLGLIIIGATAVLSSSRGLVVCCATGAGYVVFAYSTTRVRWCLCALGCIFAPLVAAFLATTGAFDLGETSNAIKVGHAVSFFDYLSPSRLLFGEGLGSYYYSSGRDAMVAQTEITIFDSIRYLGLPLTLVLYWTILFPSFASAYRRDRGVPLVLMSIYLVLSMTNPVLFNPFGLIVVVWYWDKVLPDFRTAKMRKIVGAV